MVGNLGAAVSAVAFPFFVDHVTIPYLAESTGTASSFFVFAAVMNALAVIAWLMMNPLRQLKPESPQALLLRIVLFGALIVTVVNALVYTKFFLSNDKPSEDPTPPPAVEEPQR